jgi:hypothetical protein
MYGLLSLLITIFWALWFGGAISLFIFVTSLFNRDRELAIKVAPILFLTFERYHLILAATAIVLSGIWLIAGKSRMKAALFVVFFLAGFATFISGAVVTPKIMQLREQNQIKTHEFARMHGISMMVYSSEAILVLLAGILLQIESSRASRQPSTAAAASSDSIEG